MPTTGVFEAVDIGYDVGNREFVVTGHGDEDTQVEHRVLFVHIDGIELTACTSLALERDDGIICTIDGDTARLSRYRAAQ
jgi:aerobic-type carbon monoxide dehydrogenase small subunit (CoxS/CutS family)